MLLKCYTQYASKFGKQQWPQDWKRSVFIPIPKKGNAKEYSNYHTIALISHVSKEKAMAPHSSTLAWKLPWTEKPGRLQSVGSRRVRNWATSLSLFTFMHWRRKWQPTPAFLPGESQGRGSLVGCCLRGLTESDQLKWPSSSSKESKTLWFDQLDLPI